MEPIPEKPETRAQERENAEPEERIRPMPLAAAAVTLVMVLFGVVYMLHVRPGGQRGAWVTGAPWPICRARHRPPRRCRGRQGACLPPIAPPATRPPARACPACSRRSTARNGCRATPACWPTSCCTASMARSGGGRQLQRRHAAFQQLGDAELAGLASYIRSSWSNKADAVQPALFEHERKASPAARRLRAAPRSRPWPPRPAS
jgi:hypothetical protein